MPAVRTEGLTGHGEAGKTNPRKLSQLSCACLLSAMGTPHLPLPNPAGSARWQGAVLVPRVGGTEWPSTSTCLSAPLFRKQAERRRRRRRGELSGVKASGRQLAPTSRKGAKGKAVSPAGGSG